MKRKELILINMGIAVLVVAFGLLTVRLSVNEGLSSLLSSWFGSQDKQAQQQAKQDTAYDCSKKPSLNLAKYTADPHIKKLEEYQQVCSSYVTDTLMVFTSFPTDASATADATIMATKLKTFHDAGVKPIVIVEPYAGSGLMSYRDFMNGTYDSALQHYFDKLKASGITDDMMGMWVPFPESNTPNWNNKDTQPEDFATCVNKYMGYMKGDFPNAKGSVLLSAVTYDPNDLEWANGDYLDLTPYLQNINKSYVTSIGIQGFPWVSKSTASPRREIFKASEFLQPDLAIAAARELHTRDIWFNTGSFYAKYTNDKSSEVTLSPSERKAILDSVIDAVQYIQDYQQNEYRVSVNVFSQDKSSVTEATDWSYGQDINDKTVFREFMARASQGNIPVSLFDKDINNKGL